MTLPTVHVIIPVYNGERFLGEAIESVLNQTYTGPVELTVVDDGSTDASATIAESYEGVRVVRQANAGQPASINRAVDLANAPLVAFLDADDVWVPEKLEWQVAAMTDEVDVVVGLTEQFAEAGLPEAAARYKALPPAHRVMEARLPSAVLIRHEGFYTAGPFDSDAGVANVVEWYSRVQDAGLREAVVQEVVYRRRIHDANIGIRKKEQATQDYLAVVKAALDRRRAASSTG
ncbi:MAG: glycosyltransferase family A protein [Rubricoccaceae bacterium]